jgi:threonine aldolase
VTGALPAARDLRTDALPRLSEATWDAMRAHELGWATFGEDAAVRELETRGAALAGKEAALLVPTGAMANLVALLSWTRPGDGLIADRAAHVVRAEHAGYAAVAGLALRALDGERGHPGAAQVAALLDDAPAGRPQPAGLVWLENTHGAAGGTVQPLEDIRAVCAEAQDRGLPVHLDGARSLNAAVALGVSLAALLEPVDSAMLSLNKGIGGPLGALLSGSEEFVVRAREQLVRLGGASVHLAGHWAAAALAGLDAAPAIAARDHAVARHLAARLAAIPEVELGPVETNILLVRTRAPRGAALIAALRERGIGAFPHSLDQIRFVVHRDVGEADADAVAAELAAIVTNPGATT